MVGGMIKVTTEKVELLQRVIRGYSVRLQAPVNSYTVVISSYPKPKSAHFSVAYLYKHLMHFFLRYTSINQNWGYGWGYDSDHTPLEAHIRILTSRKVQ